MTEAQEERASIMEFDGGATRLDAEAAALTLTPTASKAAATDAIKAEVRTLVVTGPNIPAMLQAVAVDMQVAPTIDVDCDEMAEELNTMLGRFSTVAAALEAERLERGKPLQDALKWLMAGYSPSRDNLLLLIGDGKKKLMAWGEQKAELARKAAEDEARKRQEAAALAAKQEAEAIAAANAQAVEAARLRDAGSEQVAAAMESQAMVAVDTARQTAAAAAQAVFTGPATLPSSGRAVGRGARTTWKAECTDKTTLLIHVAALAAKGDLSLMRVFTIDPKAINDMAKLQEANLKVPGLRPYSEGGLAIKKQAVETAAAGPAGA